MDIYLRFADVAIVASLIEDTSGPPACPSQRIMPSTLACTHIYMLTWRGSHQQGYTIQTLHISTSRPGHNARCLRPASEVRGGGDDVTPAFAPAEACGGATALEVGTVAKALYAALLGPPVTAVAVSAAFRRRLREARALRS